MSYLIIEIGVIIFLISIFILVIGYRKSNLHADYLELKKKCQYLKDEFNKEADQLRDLHIKEQKIIEDMQKAINDREVAVQRAADAQAATEQLLQSEQGRLAAQLQRTKELEEVKFEQEKEKRQQWLDLYFEKLNKQQEQIYNDRKEELNAEILSLESQLDDFRSRQEAVNEAIRREEELQNQLDSHRIILNNNSKEDIQYLLSIESNIHNKELLHKLIWSEYLQRPFNQMINNSFGAKIPKNVIYCIENIESKKKYIGKTSAEVSKRWTEHIKSSLNIGTIKKQPIHEVLFKNWDAFTFTIIEEVKDDKLGDREKYYINFFQTDKYGFNIKGGG